MATFQQKSRREWERSLDGAPPGIGEKTRPERVDGWTEKKEGAGVVGNTDVISKQSDKNFRQVRDSKGTEKKKNVEERL